MTLALVQETFWRALRGEAVDPEGSFADIATLSAKAGLEVYADIILNRQIESLRADFPETLAAFGEEGFGRLAHDFVRGLPSKDPDLGRLGGQFVAFVPLDSRGLAELEWARTEVFVEGDDTPLSSEALAEKLDPLRFSEARLRLIRALRLVGATAIWRDGLDINEATLPASEARALRAAVKGAKAGDFFASFDRQEDAFASLRGWIARGWVAGVLDGAA